jgi:hypothetical protein
MVGCPFHVLELANQLWLQPQCRKPDYAASAAASVVISAFSALSFRHNQTAYAATESCLVCSRQ